MAKKVYEVHPRIKEKWKGLKREIRRLSKEQARLNHLASSQPWKDSQLTKKVLVKIEEDLKQARKLFIEAEVDYTNRYGGI